MIAGFETRGKASFFAADSRVGRDVGWRVMRALACLLVLSCPASAACTTADIEVKQFDVRPAAARELARFIGEIVNRCAEPVAPEIQVTFRDKEGKVTNVEEFSPTGNRSLGPGVSYPFDRMMKRDVDATTMSVRVIDVRQGR